jgi:hypothetical protein
MWSGSNLRSRSVVASGRCSRPWRRVIAALVECSCAALWGGSASAAASYACGLAKVKNGHTMRVQVIRGNVLCSLARVVMRYSTPTPGDLPSAWACSGSTRGTITCTKGNRTVHGRAIYY